MNFKNMLKYQLTSTMGVVCIFSLMTFAIFAGLYLLQFILPHFLVSDQGSYNLSSTVYLFAIIFGMTTFKSILEFGVINGVSRKTIFMSTTVTYGVTSLVIAIMCLLFTFLTKGFMPTSDMFVFFYGERYGIDVIFQNTIHQHSLNSVFPNILWTTIVLFLLFVLGYFITVLYYRMSTIWKYIVSIGVPALAITVIPMIATSSVGDELIPIMLDTLSFTQGFASDIPNPYISVISLSLVIAIFTTINYLMMRRASIKQK